MKLNMYQTFKKIPIFQAKKEEIKLITNEKMNRFVCIKMWEKHTCRKTDKQFMCVLYGEFIQNNKKNMGIPKEQEKNINNILKKNTVRTLKYEKMSMS